MSDTIVVTGGGGLLGSYLLPLLTGTGEVYATTHSGGENLPANVKHLPIDLSRPLDASRLPKKIDQVIYLAQSSRFRDFPESAQDIFQVNTGQVLAMLDQARRAGAKSFVYASTGGVYAPSDEPLTETSPIGQGLAFYPASKRAAEVLAEAFAHFFHVVVLRYFFLYGHGQKRDMLVPRLADSVRNGRPVTLQGMDGLRINPVHASDAARATLAAARLGRSGTFNVAGPEVLSLREMCECIGHKTGREPVFDTHPEQKAPTMVADTSAMRASLAAPVRRFADGVADVLEQP